MSQNWIIDFKINMFILELDKVSSLTQARFAAGEGFTHVCFDLAGMSEREINFQAVKDWLSGVKIGIWVDEEARVDLGAVDYIKERLDGSRVLATPTQPDADETDFIVVSKLPQTGGELKCVLSVSDNQLGDIETLSGHLDGLCGISLQAPPEERTGFLIVSDELRNFLDLLEDRELKGM